MHQNGIKTYYVRRATGFSASRISPFLKGEPTYLSVEMFERLLKVLRDSAPDAFVVFWNHNVFEILLESGDGE